MLTVFRTLTSVVILITRRITDLSTQRLVRHVSFCSEIGLFRFFESFKFYWIIGRMCRILIKIMKNRIENSVNGNDMS